MKVTLDTHALIWWLSDIGQLEPQARALISDPGNDVLVSVASLWEIAVKVRVGKLAANVPEIADAIERGDFTWLDISPTHLKALGGLPLHSDRRDPFDHLLIAQVTAEGAAIVSDDRNASRYAAKVVRYSGSSVPPA